MIGRTVNYSLPENFRFGTDGYFPNISDLAVLQGAECVCGVGGSVPVRDKLYKHGNVVSQTCPRCVQNDKMVLCALVQCPSIANLRIYVEHLPSRVGWIRLSTESIVPPPSFNREGKDVFICLVAMVKEVVCWMRLKGLKSNTFLIGRSLTNFFDFHLKRKIRVVREVLSFGQFADRWIKVA